MPPPPDSPEKSLPPPWDRIFSLATRGFVWGLLIAVLWILSPFLLLIFLTFVFSYIQAHGVDGLEHRIKNRTVRVVIVGLVFLGTLFATGFTLAPQVTQQGQTFWQNRDKYIRDADEQLDTFLRQWPTIHQSILEHRPPPSPAKKPAEGTAANGAGPGKEQENRKVQDGEPQNGEPQNPELQNPELQNPESQSPESPNPESPNPESPNPESQNGEVGAPGPQAPGESGADDETEKPAQARKLTLVADFITNAGEVLQQSSLAIGQSVLGYASAFLLALLFSFLIVLDLPKIKRGVRGLADTKVGFIYDEVAENIAGFGKVLGRALEAQLFIAIVNTILTAVGIWLMGLPNLLVLSTIVFFCSFIPVAGTFISSTPICLIALQTGGVTTMLLAILLICIIHAVETYVLNPQIYGHHMHMNPVVVLIVLTVGGKLFGVWGLLLGIPIVNYFWRHAIRRPEDRPATA